MSVIPLDARRRAKAEAAAPEPGPFTFLTPPELQAALVERSNAEELLTLATTLAAIHRTYVTVAGKSRAEAIKARMRLILGSPA